MRTESSAQRRLIVGTAALWIAGFAILFFALPLATSRVPLSDELDLAAGLVPAWSFLQVCLLAGVLAALRRRAGDWSPRARTVVAITIAVLIGLLQPWAISILIGRGSESLADPIQVSLAWTMALVFYVMPSVVVIAAWLRRERPVPTLSALGLALFVIAVGSLPYVFWLTHLWRVYVEPSGGETVRRFTGTLLALIG